MIKIVEIKLLIFSPSDGGLYGVMDVLFFLMIEAS